AQRAPEWHLAVRPSARDAPSPAAALVPDSNGLHTATKISRRYPQSGLTAPNGGIRSASSIGTIVRSSAVVVGQRSERGVPSWAKHDSVPALRVNVPDVRSTGLSHVMDGS